MRSESLIREEGLDLQNIERAFLWQELGRDFIRQIIYIDPLIRTKIDHHIIAALQGFASYPSMFYSNAFCYLRNSLSEQKDLEYYSNRIYQLYREQAEKEYNSRQIYRIVDRTGKVLDAWVI